MAAIIQNSLLLDKLREAWKAFTVLLRRQGSSSVILGSLPSQGYDIVFASAPGNMILMGEYAVLEDAPAVLMTLKYRLNIELRAADVFKIESDKFGIWQEGEERPPHVVLCQNVINSFSRRAGKEQDVFNISIASDIPPTYGFGSSAALVAVLVKALCEFYTLPEDFTEMFTIGHQAILETFGRGSGADLAAALADQPFIVFDPATKTAMPMAFPFQVQAIYTGYKTPTSEVLRHVAATVADDDWKKITAKMRACVTQFVAAPSADLIEKYQFYMNALGVTCDQCAAALDVFKQQNISAKISGSGMGDCVVGFSKAPANVNIEAPFVFLPQGELAA